MSAFMEGFVTLVTAAALIAVVSALVSRRSQTPAVIQAGGSAVSNIFGVAEAPVTGASYSPVLSYPGSDMSGGFGYGTFG
jgi:hypothetical protein